MKRWPTIPVAPRMPIFCRCMILFPISEDVHQGPHRTCAGLFAVQTSVTVSYTGMHPRNCGSKEKRPLYSCKGLHSRIGLSSIYCMNCHPELSEGSDASIHQHEKGCP